ncbi:rhomboid family intramembrane serine protease [Vallitaleaceae bacterium 9-2]
MSEESLKDYQLLKDYFEAKNYQQIATDSKEHALYSLYQKSSYYIVSILHGTKANKLDINRYAFYMQNLSSQFQQFHTDRVIILNLFVGEWEPQIYAYYNKMPNIEATTIEVAWFIDSLQRKLVIPEHQLNSIMGIEKDLRILLKEKKQNYYAIEKETEAHYTTLAIGIINVIVWIFMEINGGSTDPNVLMRFGAIQVDFIVRTQQYWRLLSAMFVHIGIMHLFFNMFGLYIFGSRLEKYISAKQFLMIYLGAGIVGSIFSFAYHYFTGPYIIAAGASGAIYGIIGAALVLSRAMNNSMDGINHYIIWLFFIYGIVYSVISPNVDLYAHVGGFIGGICISVPIVRRRRKEIGGSKDETR